MMKPLIFAVALLTVPMAGCSTISGVFGGGTAHQVAEKALIDCDTAYVAIADVVAVLPADKQAAGRTIQANAWAVLQAARDLYAHNQAPTAAAASLAALAAQAHSL